MYHKILVFFFSPSHLKIVNSVLSQQARFGQQTIVCQLWLRAKSTQWPEASELWPGLSWLRLAKTQKLLK